MTSEAAAALRAEHERIRALHRRSMKLAAAARQLKVAASTAGLLAKDGISKWISRATAAAPSS